MSPIRSAFQVCGIATAILFAGCKSKDNVGSENVNPDVVYQIYDVRYDAATDANHWFARFRVGGDTGTNLELNPPCGVSANGQAMAKGEGNYLTALGGVLPGTYYHGRGAGFTKSHGFEYKTATGGVLKNSITMEPIGFPADTPTTVSRSKSLAVRFTGVPLRAGEKVHLQLNTAMLPGDAGEKPVHLQTATISAAGAAEVTLTADQISALLDGPGTLSLMRVLERTPQATAAKAGGVISSTYQAKALSITLIP